MENKEVYPLKCPICGKATNYIYRIEADKEKTDWYRCQCGIIFQDKFPGYSAFNSEYLKRYDTEMTANAEHTARIYAPVVEDMTYGRMFLDVGYGTNYVMDFFKKRGWLTWGIDINEGIKQVSGNQYKGDFSYYDFNPSGGHESVERFKGRFGAEKRPFTRITISSPLIQFGKKIKEWVQ